MNKHIEEMAKVMCGKSKPCSLCEVQAPCRCQTDAELLNAEGYRKQIVGEWIFEHESYGKMLCSNCKEEALVNDRNEYVDSDFCHNCGARMKGDEGR